ncbi:MAG: hypothetical protein IPJ21_16800 [Sterolibacteriaceae bacterium]|jgi:hypothetical protein|nr:hypothetical protein [Sterolibacteriaceae bacterium]MBK9085429.1 hypothetical protein [Sterolibacteriaceae bacterium]
MRESFIGEPRPEGEFSFTLAGRHEVGVVPIPVAQAGSVRLRESKFRFRHEPA